MLIGQAIRACSLGDTADQRSRVPPIRPGKIVPLQTSEILSNDIDLVRLHIMFTLIIRLVHKPLHV